MKAANGENYDDICYAPDLDFSALRRQLPLLVDVAKKGEVPRLLSEIHKLLRLYLVVPVTSATAERTFSVLRRLLVYLRSTMTEMRLNNCLLLHVHKDITDTMNLEDIAKEFVARKVESNHFGSFYIIMNYA